MDYQTHEGDSLGLDLGSPFYLDHIARYWWAQSQAEALDVLDCATGKGYGAFIMSKSARSVLGIDLNPESLKLAATTFSNIPHLSYQAQDVLALEELGKKFDLITAFEIIEHVPIETTDRFLEGLGHILKPSGKLLISTPNHEVVMKSGASVPEFHINNFPSSKLKESLEKHFHQVEMLGQYRKRGPLYNFAFTLDLFNLRHIVNRFFKRKRDSRLSENSSEKSSKRSNISQELFKDRPSELEEYSFSPFHWRQAGLSVAVCSSPKQNNLEIKNGRSL